MFTLSGDALFVVCLHMHTAVALVSMHAAVVLV